MAPARLTIDDLNTANEGKLARSLNISPRLAQRIMRMRPYHSPEDLKRVWGLDEKTVTLLTAILQESAAVGSTAAIEAADPAVSQVVEAPAARIPSEIEEPETPREPRRLSLGTTLVLLAILLVGAYLRLSGLEWDQNTHQHPDERFMTIVAERIQPVALSDYFNTDVSTLNPFQAGAGYTYGMLPLFLTRMVGGWLDMTHYDKVVLVGRVLSGLFDLAALLMLFVLGRMIFDRRVGLLAAGLYAVAVLPIQLSHFFAVDSFATVFIVAGFIFAYQAVPLLPGKNSSRKISLVHFGLFGLVTGLAMACKINTIAFFGVIGLAAIAYLATVWGNKAKRWHTVWDLAKGLLIAAAIGFAAFRIANPYTFVGPDFFGLRIYPRWLQVMKEVTGQVAGRSEWPPNHHWTSRGPAYAWLNMVGWGLGWPLGLAAWAGWIYAAWRCFKGEWRRLLLLVVWVVGYFLWQNIQFWRYMRYFQPIYPILVLLAAWGLVRLWDWAQVSRRALKARFRPGPREKFGWKTSLPGLAVWGALVVVLGGTLLYAIGFTDIYRQPITRIAASQWMVQNIRGPLNVVVDSDDGAQTYPISSPARFTFAAGERYHSAFIPTTSGTTSRIETVRVRLALVDLRIKIYEDAEKQSQLGEGYVIVPAGDELNSLMVTLPALTMEAGKTYTVVYTLKSGGPVELSSAVLRTEKDDATQLPVDWQLSHTRAVTTNGTLEFTPVENMRINRLVFNEFSGKADAQRARVEVMVTGDDAGDKVLASSEGSIDLGDGTGNAEPVFSFDSLALKAGTTYYVRYQVKSGGPLIFEPELYALETSWDDALPLSVKPYSLIGGVYAPLNLQLYEPDTKAKRESMLRILERAEYLVLPSNRAYDAMPRLTQRYPLTLAYYQNLFDCDCSGDEMEAWAAQLETPFHSPLGFDLVATFSHHPSLGPFELNDQLADESFTVYDHPKVMIFKKSADFSIDDVRALLESVDLSQVVFQAPLAVTRNPTGYQMPADRLEAQQAGGTWTSLFDSESWLNTNQSAGVVAWYLTILLLSLLFLPATLTLFRGLPDRGYALGRVLALLAVAWLTWLLASLKLVPFTRWAIVLTVVLFATVNAWLALKRREDLADFLKTRWRYLLGVEVLFLVLFGLGLLLRLGNPDLWQPWTGGEKPMNLTIFNSVLKSTWFPPLHPWLSGYYLNYYYFGYILAAIPTRLLGILPAFAYNLILPTWFAMTGIGIFSAAANLALKLRKRADAKGKVWSARTVWTAGLAAVILMLVLGNLFQVGRLWERLPEVAGVENADTLTGFPRLTAVISGAGRVISGEVEMPGSKASWYFDASRPILNGVNEGKETPIAEFPLFTYLYGDMHPHLLVMPLLFAALAWLMSLFFEREPLKFNLGQILFWAAGGLILGAFRAANTWDYLTLLGLAVVTAGWTSWQAHRKLAKPFFVELGITLALVIGLSIGLYYPFGQWFVTGYNSVQLWTGARTPLGDYLTVHGVFLFVLISYLIFESDTWLKERLKHWKANRYDVTLPVGKGWIPVGIGAAVIAGLMWVFIRYIPAALAAVPLLVWCGLLVLKRNQEPARQFVLALFAAGLALTLLVEVVALKGDSARMNVVFKFYMQVWAIFSLAAGAALEVLLRQWRSWIPEWRWPWAVGLTLLVLGGLTYTISAIPARSSDRWPEIDKPPVTLNGMEYMLGEAVNVRADYDPALGAVYDDGGSRLHLGYDYAGIRFLQETAIGSPTIVEGIRGEYKLTGRYAINTGLPAVASWSWHVRQHNSLMDGAIVDRRIEDVKEFYDTTDLETALAFLRRYQVTYVIVGDLERAFYAPEGLPKFQTLVERGHLSEVFSREGAEGAVKIYQVVTQP